MGVTVGLLDFYILEAGEYVDQLDALVGAAVQAPPESTPFITAARAASRELDDGEADPHGGAGRLGGARRARVAGRLRPLERRGALRSRRRRSTTFGFCFGQFGAGAPRRNSAPRRASPSCGRSFPRAARGHGQHADQRCGEPCVLRVGGRRRSPQRSMPMSALRPIVSALDEALGRVRALRGIAALKDLPPLADVADALETAAKTTMVDGRALSQQHAELYDASAHALRRAARELRTTGSSRRNGARSPTIRPRPLWHFNSSRATKSQVVPVSSLFFGDAGPHIVSRADRPPAASGIAIPQRGHVARGTSSATRRRRQDGHDVGRPRADRSRAAWGTSRHSVDDRKLRPGGRFALFRERRRGGEHPRPDRPLVDRRGGRARGHLPRVPLENLAARLESSVARTRSTARSPPVSARSINRRAPRRRRHGPPPSRARRAVRRGGSPGSPNPGEPNVGAARKAPPTPTGPELTQFLQSGIAGFNELDRTPLAPPAPLDDATLVSIDDLLYRGRAALDRAIEVRDLIRLSGGNTDEALAELFDLLDLAAAD